MPLTKAQCTNCGGTLEIDSNKDAAVCPFCNTPYVVEKAINLFKTENHVVNNISYNGEGIPPELKIKNAWILIRDNHIDAALKLLDEYARVNPNDYRLWLGYYFCRNKEDRASLASAKEKSMPELKERLSSQLAHIVEMDSKSNEINQLRQRNALMKKSINHVPVLPVVFGVLGFILLPGIISIAEDIYTSIFAFILILVFVCPAVLSIIHHNIKVNKYKEAVSEINDAEKHYGELMGVKISNDRNLFGFVMQSFGEEQ